MKNSTLYFVLFFGATLVAFRQRTNEIDSLKTDADVSEFWQERVSAKKQKLPLFPFYTGRLHVNDSLGSKNWIKTDFDGNGETDLLVFRVEGVTEILIVLSKKGSYELVKPNYANSHRYQFVYPITKPINKKNAILLYNQRQTGVLDKTGNMVYTKLECDTLVFKYGRVLNYSSRSQKHKIEQVTVENNGSCEGDCPKTTVTINSTDFSSSALKQDDNGRVYQGSLSKKDIRTINDLLNYANFPSLKSEYRANEFDLTTTTMTIVYDGGQQKIIKDYGSTGTFTLAEIYRTAYGIKWMPTR